MIINIALKDFHNNLISARFAIGFILCLFLIPFTMLVSINDYRSQVINYEIAREAADRINEVRVYSALRPEIVIPPEPLSIFSRGISFNVGNTVKILLGEKPLFATGQVATRENPLMNAFFSIDFISIIAIILSLIAIIFTYDACSREREDGTLKLALSNPVSRSTILLGKIIGVMLTLIPILLFCYLLSVIMILFSPHISFSAGEWTRIGLLFAASILFFTLFIMIGIFVSTRFRSSAASMVTCLSIWIVACFVISNLSVYAASSFVNVDSREKLNRDLEMVSDEFYEKHEYKGDYMSFKGNYIGSDGYAEMTATPKKLIEDIRNNRIESEPARIEYAEKKWAYQKEYLDKLDNQRTFAEHLSFVSPTEIFQLLASELCRTDVQSYYRFLDMTRQYREQLIQYFQDNDIFSSYTYFTREKPEEFMTLDEMTSISSGGVFKTWASFMSWAEKHSGDLSPLFKGSLELKAYGEYPPLDLSDIPRFNFEPVPLTVELKKTLFKISAMILCGIVLFYLSFVSFTRYDVR
ncbi:ABC transporter permease subunit [Candidatus Latescibacterota bacterium]